MIQRTQARFESFCERTLARFESFYGARKGSIIFALAPAFVVTHEFITVIDVVVVVKREGTSLQSNEPINLALGPLAGNLDML